MTYGQLAEKQVYEGCVKLLSLAGGVVFRLSQARPSRQSAGVPDLCVFVSDRFAWIEVKRPGGKLRPEQVLFQDLCRRASIEHVVGGLKEVKELLVRWGKVAA